jgi:hypothetical protein
MRHSILTLLCLVVLFVAHPATAAAACPPPTVNQGSVCVLMADTVLNDTLWLTSGTHLDCQGHRLTPVTNGSLDDPRTIAIEFQPSHPELAIFVRNAYDVQIQNCVMSGFDFGIIIAQSKAAGAPNGQTLNIIRSNNIDVRTNAVDIIKSDGVVISGNRLTYASERGRGLVLDFDSDDNQVTGNTIISTDAASTGQVRQLPGGPFVTNLAIMDNKIHILQADKVLQNFVVSGVLVQVPAGERQTDLEDTGRSDHNLVEANTIIDLGVGASCTLDPGTSCQADTDCPGKGACLRKQNSGVGFNIRAADNIVRGNTFSGRMDRGISFGGVPAVMTFPNWYPGKCVRNTSRLCSMDSDCNIPGYDTTDTGPCVGVGSATFNGNTLRLTASGNTLSGVYDTAAMLASNTDTFVFSGNTISGGVSGIRINTVGINGTVQGNVVSGAGNALYLGAQSPFTSAISLNDFKNYSVAIRTSNDSTTLTNITPGNGNYWGLPCPGFDPARVLFDNGLVNPFVFDGKPYGVPVAQPVGTTQPNPCK